MREEGDIADYDHIVVACDLLKDARQSIAGVLTVPCEQLSIGGDYALGRVEQTFPCGVVAGPADQYADSGLRFLATWSNDP
jgi:hypothetical protein